MKKWWDKHGREWKKLKRARDLTENQTTNTEPPGR